MWVHSRQAHNIKAAELHAILDHFSIDASNPVICLTQVCFQRTSHPALLDSWDMLLFPHHPAGVRSNTACMRV